MGATDGGPDVGPQGHARRVTTPPTGTLVRPELAQAAFAGTADAIVVVDDSGRVVEFNPAAEKVFGRSRRDVLGQDMVRLLIPTHRRRAYRNMMQRYLRTGDDATLRAFYRRSASALRADGTEFSTESTIVPLVVDEKRYFCEHVRDTSDLAKTTSALVADITAIKAAEAERERVLAREREARWHAAENAERLTRLVTALPAAVLVEDERRRVVLVNDSFCDVFRLPAAPADLVGTEAESVMAQIKHIAADPDAFALRTSQVAAARALVVDEEVVFADGQIFDRDYVPIFVGQMWHGQLWMYWEVTQRRAFERQRERMLAAELKARKATEAARRKLGEQNQRLRELDKFKSDFVATLSHELRTPLTSIISFTGLLREAEASTSSQATEFLDIIERNSDRLLRLVSDLLLLFHLEAGSLPLDLSDVSVHDLADEAVRARSAPANRRGVLLELRVDDGPPIRVDRHRMLQVLDNLISNAIKFTDPRGSVRVAARFADGEWRIEVADSGIGIPTEEQEKIFDRFFRASNARIDAVPGTGLGLSVVKAIVDLHGARLDVRSTPGKGTTFTLILKASR